MRYTCFMKFTSKFVLGLLLVLISFVSVADLFYRPGHPVTFDGHVHMTTMNQFAQAIKDGDFPVTWVNNFANFGHPLSNIAHQVPAYLGALLIIAGFTTEFSYIILIFASVVFSSFLFYAFFRKFANHPLAFTATVISVFFPYRALNIYTRGALPEIMATVFLPVLLLGIWHLKQKTYLKSAFYLYFGVLLTALIHPMMIIIFFVPVAAYFFYQLDKKTLKKQISIAGISSLLGGLSASYYLIPLFFEMKYFYQSKIEQKVGNDTFLSLKQLYDPSWFYTLTHPGPRGNYIKLGSIEFFIMLLAIILLLISFFAAKTTLKKYLVKEELKNLIFWTGLGILLVLLMLPVSKFLYSLPIIYQIQYPWRFLTAMQIVIPTIFIFLIKSVKKINNSYLLLAVIATILCSRIPQFYGKNYIVQPESDYQFNQANLHSVNFNTVWSDNSENYEKKSVQAKIIEGDGTLEIIESKNSSRTYKTYSEEQIRLIDYTFYFSGWAVYVDSKPISFEFQDPNYRGIITYKVPPGEHEIRVVYEYTTVRILGVIITILGIMAAATWLYLLRSKYHKSN